MKSKLLIGSLLLLFGVCGSYYFLEEPNEYLVKHESVMKNRKGRIPKKDRIDLAWAQEYEMTMDPNTKDVPVDRLIEAWQYTQNLFWRMNKAAIPGVNWQSRGPNNCGGRTRAICFDIRDTTYKTIWVAGVNGGLWRTTDITANEPNWAPINDFLQNLAITYIVQAPGNPNIMYFGTGEGNGNADAARGLGIWKSTNGGNTWAQLSATNNSSYYYCQKLYTTANGDTLFAATRTGLYRSTNGGTSFTRVLGTTSTIAYDIERAANGTYYASVSTGSSNTGAVHKSFNQGSSWTAVTLPTYVNKREIELAMAINDTNTIWGLVENASRVTAIIKSNNAGNTWDTVSTHPIDADPGIPGAGNPWKDISRNQGWYDLSIAVDPNNSQVCFVGGIDLFKTSNGGASWQQISHWYGGFGFQNVHADQHYAVFSPGSSSILYFTNDGGIYRTDNATASIPTIVSKEKNYITTQFYACDIHPTAGNNYYLAGAQDNGSHRFNTVGINATTEVTGGDGVFCHIDQNEPSFQFTSYVYNNFYRSINGGNSFSGVSYGNSGRFVNPSDYDDSLNIMYSALSTNNYLRWNDPKTGNSFTPVSVSAITAQVSAVKVSPNITNRVYFGSSNGRIVRVDSANLDTSRNGTHINSGVTGFSNYVSCIEVETGNENHILVTQSNYGVTNIWETKNGGISWLACDGNLPDMPVRWILLNPTKPWQALIATELGVWSTDSIRETSTDWQPSNTGLANTRATMLKMRKSDRQVIVSTHGRGLFSSDVFMDPFAEFTANRKIIYEGQSIQFTNQSSKSVSYLWNFGDGTNSNVANPVKTYTTAGVYSVTLTINGGASSKVYTNYIHVLPYRPVPYTLTMGGNFDANPNEFASSSLSGTAFARGNSTTTGKNGTRSGNFAWVTGLSGNYQNLSNSYLYTPVFNFTASGLYTIRFYCKNVFEIGYDGFMLEYSLDTGTTWLPLGTTTSAGWYDFANNTQNTSFLRFQPYFNNTNSNYTLKTFATTALQGNGRVSFRFVFKSDQSSTAAGLAIEDFEILGPVNGILPLKLLSFKGKRTSNTQVLLNWETQSEVNVDHFEIERKFDWNDEFNPLGKIASGDPSKQMQTYQYIDENNHQGNSYYRLKIVDTDGQYEYSSVVTVYKNNIFSPIQILPVSQFAKTFKLHCEMPQFIEIQIKNSNGQLVKSLSIQTDEFMDLSALSTGIYFLSMKMKDGSIFVQKLLIH